MGRQVFASGFESIDVATRVAESLQKYHNRRHHQRGRPLFMEDLPKGHLVTVLGECENGPTIYIPLYSSEPTSHGYETVKDLMEIIKRLHPEYDHTVGELRIKLD